MYNHPHFDTLQAFGRRHQNQMSGHEANLHKFINDAVNELERLQRSLHYSNESLKSQHEPITVRALRARMDADVAHALNNAKRAEFLLKAGSKAANSSPVMAGLRNKLKKSVADFARLQSCVIADYREAVERLYYIVTGEMADKETGDILVASRGGEILVGCNQRQGWGESDGIIAEMKERQELAQEIELKLAELQQILRNILMVVTNSPLAQDTIEKVDDVRINVVGSYSSGEKLDNNRISVPEMNHLVIQGTRNHVNASSAVVPGTKNHVNASSVVQGTRTPVNTSPVVQGTTSRVISNSQRLVCCLLLVFILVWLIGLVIGLGISPHNS